MDLIARFSKLINCILSYLIEIISIDEDEQVVELPAKLKSFKDTGDYMVLLHKNDALIFDLDLDNMIKNLLCIDVQVARLYADIFRKQGRCPVKVGSRKECEMFRNMVRIELVNLVKYFVKYNWSIWLKKIFSDNKS